MSEAVFIHFSYAIIALLGYLLYAAYRLWIEPRLPANVLAKIHEFAPIAAQEIEQLYAGELHGPQKMDHALQSVYAKLEALKLPPPDEKLIKSAIEAAVLLLPTKPIDLPPMTITMPIAKP
jgi:hypothetical protein